jgi:hypothetical protein
MSILDLIKLIFAPVIVVFQLYLRVDFPHAFRGKRHKYCEFCITFYEILSCLKYINSKVSWSLGKMSQTGCSSHHNM